MALLLPGLAHAASAYCPTLSATVAKGGSVVIDVDICDGPDNFGVGTFGSTTPHGSIVLSDQTPSPQTVTYTHNGDAATSDTFNLEDGDGEIITVNITITQPASASASIAVSPSSRNEDSNQSFTYTVTLSQTNSSATTVNLSTSGTATSGSDYSGAVDSVVVPANTATATFTITPIADTTVEADETATMTIASGTDYTVGSPASATATILNDDVPAASIAVAPASVPEDGAGNLVYTVSLSQAPLSAVSVAFTVGGSATSGTDFAAVTSPLVIAAGQTSGTITVTPSADGTVEPDETVVLTLSADTGYSVGSPASATGTILNDDQPTLSIDDVSLSEGDAGTTNATFTVSLSQPAGTGGVGFDIATADGTATAGSDYVARSLSAQTIAAGGSSATFTVQVNGDTLSELDETFFVNVSNVSGASVSDAQGEGTIRDDDGLPALSIDDISVNEGNTGTATATFTVSLDAASGQTVSVNYATADGTATAGSDYVARSGTLTFAPGTTTQSVAVTVNGDTAVEPNETFSVALSGASNATIARATGTGTLSNDDAVVTVGPASLPAATAGSAYSQTLTASGGTAPYTFAISAGALPAGLTLSSAGVLSGTPTASGSFNFTATATDSAGSPTSGSRAYTLAVAGPTVDLPATALPGGTAGQAYAATINPATGGTAPYTYTLSAGALPAGLALDAATGALSGTPTAIGNFAFTLTATDSTAGTASQASRSYALVVAAPSIVIAPSTLPGAVRGAAYSQSLSASGGTAPYTYAVTGGALPAGLTLAGNGTLSGTATVEGTFNLTITATDAGTFTGTQAYALTVAGSNLALPASSLPGGTAGQAYSGAINPATGGNAPYSYALTAGSLPAGVTLDSATGAFSGVPTAAGNFGFTLTASDSTPGTAAQASRSYAISIAAPTLVIAPATLPGTVRGTTYSQMLSASGGTAPYTYAVTGGALPAGISLSAAGQLSGVPTTEGSFGLQIRATDALGFSVTQPYTLNVGVSAPSTTADTARTDANTAVSIPVTSNDAGVINSIAIVEAPAHGTASVDGLAIVYTPSKDYFGTDVLTYTATGSGGTSQAATVTITVLAGALPVATAKAATLQAGKSITIDATEGASNGPFTGAAVVTQPASGTLKVSGTDLVYTASEQASGKVNFDYTVSNAFGASAPATVSLDINPLPVAPSLVEATVAGRSASIDLTAGATGGPFTAATVVSLQPASAGTATITGTAGRYVLAFVAAEAYSGTASIAYTLSNAYSTSAVATVRFTVQGRSDPSKDADVVGILSAQADATRRMATGQISNFQRRLEQLHNGQPAVGFSNGITLTSASATSGYAMQERQHGPSAIEDLSATSSNMLADQAAVAPTGETAGLLPGGASVWTGGAVNFGKTGSTDGDASTEFNTSGLSMGADKLFADGLILGAGVGYGRDDTDVGQDGSRSKINGYTAAVYSSYRPSQAFYTDLVLGYQWLSLDSTRYVTDNGNRVSGSRDGKAWFGSLSMGYILRSKDIQLTPYGRLDIARATLDGFTERGDAIYALDYQHQTVNTSTVSAGVLAQFVVERDYGVWAPQLRAEYGRDLEGTSNALMSYADLLGGNVYRADLLQKNRNHALLGGGVSLQTLGGWILSAEYQVQLESNTGNNQSVRFGLEKKFDP